MVQADYLFLMTDVDCLYDKNPRTNPDAKAIEVVEDIAALAADGNSTPSTLLILALLIYFHSINGRIQPRYRRDVDQDCRGPIGHLGGGDDGHHSVLESRQYPQHHLVSSKQQDLHPGAHAHVY